MKIEFKGKSKILLRWKSLKPGMVVRDERGQALLVITSGEGEGAVSLLVNLKKSTYHYEWEYGKKHSFEEVKAKVVIG